MSRATRATTSPLVRALSPLRDFLRTEAAGGALLLVAAGAALGWANSPWRAGYHRLWSTPATVQVGEHQLQLDLQHWVNDGLMTVFFLVVGLEIKRELSRGHLAGRRAATLPIVAALGGMIVPAALYLAIAGGTAAHGWGVPMATDIALAVGVMALAGAAVPSSLRAFLLGLAVVDDIGAIVVIAVFYSSGVAFGWLAAAVAAVAAALVIHRLGVHHILVFTGIGALLWYTLLKAGVHPTLAGVAMGLLAPADPRTPPDLVDVDELNDLSGVEQARETVAIARSTVSTVEWLEHLLHPWTSYVIVPLFALANAGIEIGAHSVRSAWGSAVTWGVVVGLLVGKPVGVLLSVAVSTRVGLAERPLGAGRRQLVGAGNAAGIGFTVALFVAQLAFDDPVQATDAKLAILVASLASGAVALAVLRARPTTSGATPRSSRTR